MTNDVMIADMLAQRISNLPATNPETMEIREILAWMLRLIDERSPPSA